MDLLILNTNIIKLVKLVGAHLIKMLTQNAKEGA